MAPAPPPAGRLKIVARGARRLLLRLLGLIAAFVVFLVILTGAAGWYTSRPQFCKSCHIMEPYYKSWAESTHKDVSCIECHFAPGFGGAVRGKMLGLVQLAKYLTASAGPRPAAEIPDASCLRSGCHETRLLAGRVEFHGVAFDHGPHLSELRRGKQLRCTSCHSQIVQGKHMTVTESTCFLCHFKGQPFNESLGACTHCHQIPERSLDLGGGVKFTHELAYEKGVDCVSCHGDVVRGNGEVPHERCLSCHNREGDLERINDGAFMHEKHVSEHKVDCLQCHLEIKHSLDRQKIAHSAADCQSCHPGHHQKQVDMLRGTGGKLLPGEANSMVTIRADCKTCHDVKEVSATGAVTWRGTPRVCLVCHDAAKVAEFETQHKQLRSALPELEAEVKRALAAVKTANLAPERAGAVEIELKNIQHDLDLLRVGNDIHNMHYATKLSAECRQRLTAICRELNVPEPKTEP